jgi:hypothetical protein
MTEIPGIDPTVAPTGPGCVDCDATGGWWLHLRRCAECGHVGCCDSSPSQHASAHAAASGHRIVQSFEPGENWFWDYVSEDYYDGPMLADPQSHPIEQTTPGPRDRVPADWRRRVH